MLLDGPIIETWQIPAIGYQHWLLRQLLHFYIIIRSYMTPEDLTTLALAGLKQLKAETETNQQILAVLQLINTLIQLEMTTNG